jgi:hypothetical protein
MKRIYWILMAAILLGALILPAGAVNADSPQFDVSGEFSLYTTGMANMKIVGDGRVAMLEFVHTINYLNGFLVGTAIENVDARKNFISGAFSSQGIQIFTSTANSNDTFTAVVRHQGGMDDVARIEQTIIDGTGDLENLRGTMIFIAYPHYNSGGMIAYYDGDYSGKLHFAP